MRTDRPLRILQVVEATDAGVGRHALDLCAELRARDHDVHLVHSGQRMEARFEQRMLSIEGRSQPAPPGATPLV